MSKIILLDQSTINKIAAGEVIERPASVIKELVENAIDAGASAITVEIKEGGTTFIRVTDNGNGIDREDISKAFLRHSTSKIKSVEDLMIVKSLGFRGEALSSIAAVGQVEVITKTKQALTGIRYMIEGGLEKTHEEIGCPEGTTFVVRNLFFNTPARRKFLKSPTTEAGHVNELMEKIALSHPYISFKFIHNGQNKLHSAGNNQLKDIIYQVYGRDISGNLLSIDFANNWIKLHGYIGKPTISRGNRNYESFYINGRYIKSSLLQKAVEDSYKTYLPLHKYPFVVLHLEIDSERIDVNVHPTKMELRFNNSEEIYTLLNQLVSEALLEKELIPAVTMLASKPDKPLPKKDIPEPFETNRRQESKVSPAFQKPFISYSPPPQTQTIREDNRDVEKSEKKLPEQDLDSDTATQANKQFLQENLFEQKLLEEKTKDKYRIIGQLFATYWLLEYEQKLYIIDQHAAHEKVMYEKFLQDITLDEVPSQTVLPPIIVSLNMQEVTVINTYSSIFEQVGFEIEHFGGKEYAIRGIPYNLYGISQQELFIEMIDSLVEEVHSNSYDTLLNKLAMAACKAAVKANNRLSLEEVDALMEQLLTLDNPYTCPHGRPTIISMSKYELERKFKRIQ